MNRQETVFGLEALITLAEESKEKGFTIDKSLTRPLGGGFYSIVFNDGKTEIVKEPETVEEPIEAISTETPADNSVDPLLLDTLDSLTKKADLLEFASLQGIELPEGMSQPASIKKFLKGEVLYK